MNKYILFLIFPFLFLCVSCEEILFEEDISGETILLIAPKDSSVVESTAVNFSWNAVDQATSYRLQIAKPNFENATQIVTDTTVSTTNYRTTLVKSDYQWRVQGMNSGSKTAFSQARFTLKENEDFSAREVQLITPVDNKITNVTATAMQWQSVNGASLYRIQILDTNDKVLAEQTTEETSIQLTFPEGESFWQVRAENSTQSTLYSKRSIVTDTKNPKKPVLVTPANESVLSDATVSFSWTREAVAGTGEVDTLFVYSDEALTQLVRKEQAGSPAEVPLDAGTTYFWRVKAFDKAGNQGEASNTFTFTIN
ncbi:hypothetical protein ACFSTE_14815 [Aquimarina hainanensis]|uniref:Fibronectin type-III domain-containing protein n=1 Tax=Aquimarina hainanensis TaxID=1578017 RepID=A0ABW5N9X7_9FLAO